ncbi:MAG: HAMP domain-containing histidine kinase [Verrucomicrobia bacterium]|nr:HAMP domain-containing histidine kinase [Verrucomicrobiota bacterium]
MALTSEVKRSLVEYLDSQRPLIGEQAVSAIRSSNEISSSERLTDQQLIDHFPKLFADLIEYLLTNGDSGTRRRTIEGALRHGMTRWQQGYALVEVIREVGIVQRSILDEGIERFFEENSQWSESVHDVRRNLGGFFEDSVAGSVQQYVENFTEQLRNANAKLLIANENLSRLDESRLRLIRTVSHELANVLNALTLTVTLITTGKDETVRSEMLEICQRNVREMSELLNDLKDYSILIAGAAPLQIEEINVRIFADELRSSFHALTQDAGVRLELLIDPDLDVIRSDRKKVRQIITNLIANAVNYCRKPDSRVVLAFRSLSQDFCQIAVEDTGIGIPSEHLDSIFDEFKRISPSEDIKGSGLGLAITKRLVEELKGSIEVFSKVAHGSRFMVTIPKTQ